TSYQVKESDEGAQLRVLATSTDSDSSGTSAASAATSAVADIAPTLTTPVISATKIGRAAWRTGTTAATANDSDATVSYQRQSSTNGSTWTAISGATGTSYQVKESDEGAQLRVLATSTDSDSSGTSAASAATSAVADIAPTLTTPVISATSAREGDTLTVTTAATANDSDRTDARRVGT